MNIINSLKGDTDSEMKEGSFTNLPEDITRDILGRLPVRSITRCKCVCKSWRQFAESYSPKAGLVFANEETGFTACDEGFQPITQFWLPSLNNEDPYLIGSANGLILVCAGCYYFCESICVCNPITREYIELPLRPIYVLTILKYVYGFGVSRSSGQYKILYSDRRLCLVTTLGKKEYWRHISAAPGDPSKRCDKAAFLNGNLHWLASDLEENLFVCCFDLETELFTSYSIPSRDHDSLGYDTIINGGYHLCVLEGRLCLCDILRPLGIAIWRMDSYGDENSWIMEYTLDNLGGLFHPLVSLNDDLIFASNNREDRQLFIYSKNTETPATHCPLRRFAYPCLGSSIVVYTPSFISLRTMGIQDVQILKNNIEEFDIA